MRRPHGTTGPARPQRAAPPRGCTTLKTACQNDRYEIDGGLLRAAAAPAAAARNWPLRRRGIFENFTTARRKIPFQRPSFNTHAQTTADHGYRCLPSRPRTPTPSQNVPRAERSSRPPLHRKSQNSPSEATSPLFSLSSRCHRARNP